jgi:hypothetical protein
LVKAGTTAVASSFLTAVSIAEVIVEFTVVEIAVNNFSCFARSVFSRSFRSTSNL